MATENNEAILEKLVDVVLKEGASDLHLAEGRQPMIRVSGFLVPLLKYPVFSHGTMEALVKLILTKEQSEEFFNTYEVDFSYGYKDLARFRGNGYFQQGKISIALRFISPEIRTIEELNLPEILANITTKQQGFFLVVGPVGHGKSTTLASLIQVVNMTRAEHIMTIEDPIEYIFTPERSLIDQREVKIDTTDFDTALLSVFRQDADVLMIGEMRGQSTIAAAVTAAETGHLVFSTLHTNDAAQTIDRIIDTFPAGQQQQIRVQLADSLTGIFSQRLVPRISGGVIPAYELLLNTSAVSNLIRERRTHELSTVIETGTDVGMIDMNRSLGELVRRGEITIDHARAYAPHPDILERYV